MNRDSVDWIFFDLDGTIWDHHSAAKRAIQHICARYGVPPMNFWSAFKTSNDFLWSELSKGRMDFTTLRVRRFEMVLSQMACGCSSNDAQEMSATYLERYVEEPSFLPGAREALRHAAGFARVAILTNGARDVQTLKIAHLVSDSSLIQFMLCAEDTGCAKPAESFFATARDRAGSGHAMMVGDSWAEDMVPAIAAGWSAVWLSKDQEIPEAGLAGVKILPSLEHFPTLFTAGAETATP